MLEQMLPAGIIVECGDPDRTRVELMPAEHALVERAIEKRQREFAMGRQCARRALRRMGIVDFAILAGESREPLWPSGIVGSITHTRGFCAAAVARSSDFFGIGIDVELAEPLSPALANAVATPAEASRIQTMEPGLAARLVFSAKESLYKCQFYHTRHWLGFFDVSIDLEESGDFSATVLVEAPPLPRGFSIRGRWAVNEGLLFTAMWLPRVTALPG